MARLRAKNDWGYILRKDEMRVGFAVEQEVELMLRMIFRNPSHGFVSKPAYPLKFIFNQKSSVYCNSHCISFFMKAK